MVARASSRSTENLGAAVSRRSLLQALPTLLAAPTLGLASGCGSAVPMSIAHPLVGYKCPEIEATSLYGDQVLLPRYAPTRATVLDFWASWCGACQQTMPSLEALYRARENDNIAVVGISLDDRPEEAAKAAEYLGVSFPIVHDPTNRLAAYFQVTQLPTTFVIDRRAAIRYVGRSPENIRRAVVALLGE